MGIISFGAVAGLLLLAACGGNEFSAATSSSSSSGGEGGAAAGSGGDGSGGMLGSSGGAGMTMGSAGSGGVVVGGIDASMTGTGGQLTVDAGHHPDVSGGTGGATKVDASAADVGPPDTGVVATCPTTEPGGAGLCSGALKCTYGTHPRIACRRTYTCTAGQWVSSGSTMCTDLGSCTNENPLPHIGGVCPSVGHDCVWDTGLYCRCLTCPDAGCPQWNCFPPPNGCGTTPPNLGQPCDPTTTPLCDYGNCTLGTRVIVSCVNGIVNWTFPNCQ